MTRVAVVPTAEDLDSYHPDSCESWGFAEAMDVPVERVDLTDMKQQRLAVIDAGFRELAASE